MNTELKTKIINEYFTKGNVGSHVLKMHKVGPGTFYNWLKKPEFKGLVPTGRLTGKKRTKKKSSKTVDLNLALKAAESAPAKSFEKSVKSAVKDFRRAMNIVDAELQSVELGSKGELIIRVVRRIVMM